MNTKFLDIFPIKVMNKELGMDIPQLEKQCLDYMRNNIGRIVTNRGGYQTNELPKEEFPELIEKVEQTCSEYMKEIFKADVNIKVSNYWMNVNNYRDYNLKHNHPETLLTVVYYIKTPVDSGDLVLANNPMVHWWGHPYTRESWWSLGWYNSPELFFQPREDTILIFPGWVDHHVEPNLNSDEHRISIAFNTYAPTPQ